jgi:nicotinamidase-related amidase
MEIERMIEKMKKAETVLLVVDVQTVMIDEHPYNEKNVIRNIKKLISASRQNDIEVIYVRHDGGIGDELERDSDGWQIYDEIAPEAGEMIIDKQYNSAFLKTGLKQYLDNKEIKNIILVGLQTEYCIDATCKVAFEHGYKIIMPKETNTTFDNEYLTGDKLYEFYNYNIWKERFAQVITVDEMVKELSM